MQIVCDSKIVQCMAYNMAIIYQGWHAYICLGWILKLMGLKDTIC